jgi:hypothetical protein
MICFSVIVKLFQIQNTSWRYPLSVGPRALETVSKIEHVGI